MSAELDSVLSADVGDVRRDEPLARHSTWRIGGPADALVEPRRVEQLSRLLARARECGVPVTVIGDGSNLLFADEGLRGVVLRIGRAMASCVIDGVAIEAQAGLSAPRLARAAVAAGLTGLEHVIGIPGTLGGLIYMNGGSYGQTIGDALVRVEVMDRVGRARWMTRAECDFSYRHSVFQSSPDLIIVAAELELRRGDPAAIKATALADLRERRRKFPLDFPNCGSVFQSTGAMYERFGPPGKVIEDTGLKGLRIGDARVSVKHANFIENCGAATACDVLAVIGRVRHAVYERTGLWMNCEVLFVPSTGAMRPAHEFAMLDSH